MNEYITTTSVNLRREPRVNDSNRITTLPTGQLLIKIAEAEAPWWQVETRVSGKDVRGYLHSGFVRARGEVPPLTTASKVSGVHLPAGSKKITRQGEGRAYALNEEKMPRRGDSMSTQASDLTAIVNFLDVENSHRFEPHGGTTY
jgi:hypothetical protein